MFSVVFAVVAKSIGWTSETSSPSDLRKMPIRPTKSAMTCTKLSGRPTATINYFYLLRYRHDKLSC